MAIIVSMDMIMSLPSQSFEKSDIFTTRKYVLLKGRFFSHLELGKTFKNK